MKMMARAWVSGLTAAVVFMVILPAGAQQGPEPAAGEPRLADLLKQYWGLGVEHDLRNAAVEGVVPAGLFQRVDGRRPVTCTPVLAYGAEATTRGGWYAAGPGAGDLPADVLGSRKELWHYTFRSPMPAEGQDPAGPPIDKERTSFDPGDAPFGLWVANDGFNDAGVYTQPGLTAKVNERLRAQPHKARIYPTADAKTGHAVLHSYLIAFEYSTNDDFQDVIVRVDNVLLLASDPWVKGVLPPGAEVKKLAGGFKFVEGPAWDHKRGGLYFSDIPPAQIIRYADGKAEVANADSGQSNGLMFDKDVLLVACEHARRRVSRGQPAGPGRDIVTHYEGKRLNSPNDLWLDEVGGIYFTDPRYGARDDLELDKEAVYYIAADGTLTRIIDDLVQPNGIALSPDGKQLYVIDNGVSTLHRYPVLSPGKIGPGRRIALVTFPDGMSVDAQGRLYITCIGGIWVLDADGRWLGMIPTPEHPANCTFGGPGNRTLFITARTSLYGVETLTRGWHVHLDGKPPKE